MQAAVLPAALYYIGLFMMIDIEAQKMGMVGLSRKELPSIKETLKEGWFFFLPIFVLIFFLIYSKVSVTRAAFWATVCIPLCTLLGGQGKAMGIKDILKGLEKGALTALPVVAILTLAGVVLGMMTLTGLGLLMSSLLIQASGGNLFFLLLLTMVASLILGMGVPPVASYIVLAILVVPALIQLGVFPLAAHLFVFYFGCIAGITPPMAPDAFVAAGIAEASMMRTAFSACRLALVVFIVPYMFVYNNSLLLIGNPLEVLEVCVTSLIGVLGLSYAIQNYMRGKLPILLRLTLFAGSCALIYPGWRTDLFGILALGSVFMIRAPDLCRRYTIDLFSTKSPKKNGQTKMKKGD
jgi:TRAP transporter 4TM/12TM fusion protein